MTPVSPPTRARRFSDELLGREGVTFAGYRTILAASGYRMALWVRNASERGLTEAWQDRSARAMGGAMAECHADTKALLAYGFSASLTSVADELLALGYGPGLVDAMTAKVVGVADAALDIRPDLVAEGTARAVALVGEQIRVWRGFREDREALVRRISAPRPNLRRATVGVWPGTAGWISAQVHTQLFDIVNSVRLLAIETVNEG